MKRRIILSVLLGCLSGCATARPVASHPCTLTDKPILRKQPIAWHLFDVTVLSQLEQGLNMARVARTVVGRPMPSVNLINGQVPDSSFFTNRKLSALHPDEVRMGPTTPDQLPQPPFMITRLKGEGKTAGFFVTDANGDRFLFKLDRPDYPELVTGAEVVTSKLLHALGYHVPSYEIIEVAMDDLRVSSKLTVSLDALRQRLAGRARHDRIRVSASRILDGDILGPFRFKRFQCCAELRALRLAYAWVNNTDAKDHNTLMVWTANTVKGYLIDFGTALGANASKGAKGPCQGWVYDVDLKELTLELLTLGVRNSGCDPREHSWSPAVGAFSPRLDPLRWKPYAPNLAFEELTEADARWMASRLAQFSRVQLEAAVAAGKYSDARDAARIVEVLEARRQAILDVYLENETSNQ